MGFDPLGATEPWSHRVGRALWALIPLWLAITAVFAPSALMPPATLERLPAPDPHHHPNDVSCEAVPHRSKDRVRLRYRAAQESGVLEAGSWGAFAVVRVINGAASGRWRWPEGLGADFQKRAFNQIVGPDGQRFTPDDKPLRSLADASQRLALTSSQLGALLMAARHTHDTGLPTEPQHWIMVRRMPTSALEQAAMMLPGPKSPWKRSQKDLDALWRWYTMPARPCTIPRPQEPF